MPKIKVKNSFSNRLLKSIAMAGIVVVAASNPYFGLRLINGLGKDLKHKKWREFYNEVCRLKRQKRINVWQNPDGSYSVELTTIGKKFVEKYDLDNLQIQIHGEWDGGWRFFAFDIPATKKNARQALLSKLKELGFIMVQKSLWAHPFECRKELAVISKAFEVEPYVSSFLAYDLEKNWFFIKKFNEKNGMNLQV